MEYYWEELGDWEKDGEKHVLFYTNAEGENIGTHATIRRNDDGTYEAFLTWYEPPVGVFASLEEAKRYLITLRRLDGDKDLSLYAED